MSRPHQARLVVSRWSVHTLATSPRLGLEAIQAYSQEMAAKNVLATRGMDQLRTVWMRPAESFESLCSAHPELVDAEGVFAVSRAMEFENFVWGDSKADSLAEKVTQRRV